MANSCSCRYRCLYGTVLISVTPRTRRFAHDVLAKDRYVLGRIAEQFGVLDAAAEAYEKVEKPTDERAIPDSAYLLAQRRLAAMGAAAR